MNYLKIYNDLIEKAKPRGLDKRKLEGYFEKHHVEPKCLGGSDENSNLVLLTGREHFIAHLLLWKAYPDEVSLMRAAMMMSSRWSTGSIETSGAINSKTYSRLREEYSKAVTKQMSGGNNPFRGKSHTEETLDKIKATKIANGTYRKAIGLGKKHSPETILKLKASKAASSYKMSDGTKGKISKALKGKLPKNLETLKLINAGRVWTEESKQKMSASHKALGKVSWKSSAATFSTLPLWVNADIFYNYWNVNNRPDCKLFGSLIEYSYGEFYLLRKMVLDFKGGWVPSQDVEWSEFSLHNMSCTDREGLLKSLNKSVLKERKDFKSFWLDKRGEFRKDLEVAIESNKDCFSKQELTYTSNNKLTQLDALELYIIEKTNMISQKDLSEIYGVKRNSISNAVSSERFAGVKLIYSLINKSLSLKYPELFTERMKIDFRSLKEVA